MSSNNGSIKGAVALILILAALIIGAVGGLMWGIPKYRIYKQDLRGQATLREAQWTKKVTVETAKAKKESAKLLADAEIERAKGVAKANKIIGDSLEDNSEYLQYLYIDSLSETSNKIIYIPTEAGLPILEAGKR